MKAPGSQFIGELVVRAIPRWERTGKEGFSKGAQLYVTRSEFGFDSSYGRIVVPIGFVTDFGSVPKLTKFIVDDDDPDLLFGSLPHDLLYKYKGDLGRGRKLTRKEADLVLKEAMQAAGAPGWKASLVYAAVRAGGGFHWKE